MLMQYVMCPVCGKKLCKGENGTKIEIQCPKCGEKVKISIDDRDMHIELVDKKFC